MYKDIIIDKKKIKVCIYTYYVQRYYYYRLKKKGEMLL